MVSQKLVQGNAVISEFFLRPTFVQNHQIRPTIREYMILYVFCKNNKNFNKHHILRLDLYNFIKL